MAGTPAVAHRLMRQFFPQPPPPLIPISDSYPQWVCSLPGLNRFLQLWYMDHPSEGPMDRCYPYRTENHSKQLD